jgi:hypothetical protein
MGVLNEPVPKMTKFANITMTMPAFLVIMFATILFVIMVIGAIIARMPMALLGSILMYAMAIYTTYAVNCLTVGSCNLLAWVLGVVYAILIGLSVLAYVSSAYSKGFGVATKEFKMVGMRA